METATDTEKAGRTEARDKGRRGPFRHVWGRTRLLDVCPHVAGAVGQQGPAGTVTVGQRLGGWPSAELGPWKSKKRL